MKRTITAAAALALAACATQHVPEGDLAPTEGAATGGLEGTAWQLVEIVSMDDSRYAPEGDARYLLAFGADSTVQLLADCNRGRAQFFATPEGTLTFGPMAVTRMQCPPGSLHDRFLSDLTNVRSYVLEGGGLFLATWADGAILEFEPDTSGQ